MNFTQEIDLKNGRIKCNLCNRYMRRGIRTIESEDWIITICKRCKEQLKENIR